MVNVSVPIEKRDYEIFQRFVGKGNVSRVLREYMESYSKSKDKDEIILRKKLDVAFSQKEKIDAEFFELRAQLDAIESKRQLEEIKRAEKEESERKVMQDVAVNTMKKDLHRMI
jgi:hypothetical protein